MSSLLFVCTGNTCRSPMAAAIATQIFTRENLQITVQSAGVSAFPGSPASKNALLAMQAQNIDISNHKAQQTALPLLQNHALILTMTNMHKSRIIALHPTANAHTLGEYANSPTDISDPYGGTLEEYTACAAQIQALLENCIEKFKTLLP